MRISLALVSLALLAAPAAAQILPDPPSGYAQTVRSLPDNAGPVAVVGGGAGVAYFDGNRIVLDDGTAVRELMATQGTVFPSFLVPVGDSLLFGESYNGDVWLVPLDGSGERWLNSITFNFSATPFGPGRALVSAKTTGFGTSDNDILLLDLQTGQVDPVAVVPGASGPIVVGRDGDAYYATSSLLFPAPAGSVEILRFARADLESAIGPGTLTLANAQVVFGGLDSAYAMAVDGDGDLLIVDGANRNVLELNDAGGPAPWLSMFANYDASAIPPSGVQFVASVAGAPGAVFEPFQPQLSGTLVVHDSTFSAPTSRIRTIAPVRAVTVAQSTPGGGPFSITTYGAAPNAVGFLAIGAPSPDEVAVVVPGLEQPLFWAFTNASVLGLAPLSFDALGVANLSGFMGGAGRPVTLRGQVVFAGGTRAAAVIGSATPFTLSLP